MSVVAQFQKWGPFFRAGILQTAPRLYHYVAGTTTQKDAWTDQAKQATAAQPITGNADGVVAGFFDGLYKIVVKSADDAIVLEQWDSVQISDPTLTPIVATGSLPAASSNQDGTVLIEDAGGGDQNLILYAHGQRFRIDGGAAF